LRRCDPFYCCENFAVILTDKGTEFSTNTAAPFDGADEETAKRSLHIKVFGVVIIIIIIIIAIDPFIICRRYFSCES
jgi:hypothetical protein